LIRPLAQSWLKTRQSPSDRSSSLFRNSKSTGRLLYKRPDPAVGGNSPEAGLWVCTPGKWPLSIPRDEFCHFIAGRATYVRDDGEVIEVRPGTCVHFPADWTGICTVHETIRNAYMLR